MYVPNCKPPDGVLRPDSHSLRDENSVLPEQGSSPRNSQRNNVQQEAEKIDLKFSSKQLNKMRPRSYGKCPGNIAGVYKQPGVIHGKR